MKNYAGTTILAQRFAKKSGRTFVTSESLVKEVLDVLEEVLLDPTLDGVQVIDFLTLQRVKRKARIGRNPRTKVKTTIPERLDIKCILGKNFSENLRAE
jgi:nucleoid DNA-binding protein